MGLKKIGKQKAKNKKVLKKSNVILTLQSPQDTSLLSANSVFFSDPKEDQIKLFWSS